MQLPASIRALISAPILACVLASACASTDEELPPRAKAFVAPRGDATLSGLATFDVAVNGVHMVLELFDAPPGPHGVHIHDVPSCAALDASGVGHHFNPDRCYHGAAGVAGSHAGDLGNVWIDENGFGRLDVMVPYVSLFPGPRSIVGLTIGITEARDDFRTQPYGNSGPILACGQIRLD